MCAHHRGNSPATPRRSLRKSSSDHVKKKQSLHQNNSGNKSWDRKRKPSVYSKTETQTLPAVAVLGKQDSEFKIKPSSRSKRLYRTTRTLSEGFSESEHEDDWRGFNKNKNFVLSKQRKSELAKYLKSFKMSEAFIPKVVVEDFSKKLTPRFNKIKFKALTAFFEGQSKNKVVDISEVPKSGVWKSKVSAVAKISSLSKNDRSLTDIDNNPSHLGDKTLDDKNVSQIKTEKKLNRSKLLAITSFSKLGKKEIDLIEIESDSDEEQEENKEKTLTENNEQSRKATSDALTVSSEPAIKAVEEATNPEVDSKHNQETTSKIEEEIIKESLPEDTSKELLVQNTDINHEGPDGGEQRHDPQIEQSPIKRDLNPQELTQEKYSQSDFDKSRNSKTAAMFQRHGKLLEDNKRPSNENVKNKIEKDKKSRKANIFSCCLCRKKVNEQN